MEAKPGESDFGAEIVPKTHDALQRKLALTGTTKTCVVPFSPQPIASREEALTRQAPGEGFHTKRISCTVKPPLLLHHS